MRPRLAKIYLSLRQEGLPSNRVTFAFRGVIDFNIVCESVECLSPHPATSDLSLPLRQQKTMESQENVDKVFSNHFILQSILSFNHDDIVRSYFEKRLVNKAFNNAWLAVVRKEYRKLEMQFNLYRSVDRENRERTGTIHFNYRKSKVKHISNFLSFLKDVGVKVEEFRIRNGSAPPADLRKKWHDEIHQLLDRKPRKLIGLEEICNGCADCLEMAKSTSEYGPIGKESSMKMESTQQSRSLIVNERFLEQVANASISENCTWDDCIEKLDGLINSQISVDTLILWISEIRRKNVDELARDHRPFPVEVLKMVIKKWGVKSIRIVFQFGFMNQFLNDEWSERFTEFKFNDRELKKSFGIKMEHVEIDMSESYWCHREFWPLNPETYRPRGYVNLIVNTRKLFATRSISITKFVMTEPGLDRHQEVFSSILKVIRREKQTNLTINMQLFIVVSNFDLLNSTSLRPVDIPKEYVLPAKSSRPLCIYGTSSRATCNTYNFPMRKWIGKRFKIEEKEDGFEFNLDVYIPETILFHGWPEEKVNSNVKDFFELFL
ncbi:unnamed protein product [Caenorhabditis brenneri]